MWYPRAFFKHVFLRAPDHIDLWSGLVAAGFTVAAHLLPEWGEALTDLLWQIPLWAVAAVIGVRLVMAPYWIARDQRERIAELEDRLARLTNEYAYALSLDQINNEEARVRDKAGVVIERQQGIALVLRNTISRPLRYLVRELKINGVEGDGYANRGGVISPLALTTFYSCKMPVPLEGMDQPHRLEIDFEIEYGPPSKPVRLMRRSATLHVYPEGNRTRFVTKTESDTPIEGEWYGTR